ncbi:ABC transporter ATP-binding protein [Kordiimonas aestuarii]|uniref:ABC transporter ATP-binding protein n=1 Tax=Kordiimonas aestuarii TaxID=1005925 RepID=UPI0021D338E4|nr:ABC transporter ATP-binding protein [Kordiimonas aestuarii]
MSDPVNDGLSVKSLSVLLGGNDILRKVSFDLKPGEVVGLIGPNGAGKSTALKAILDIVQANQGIISIDGNNIKGLGPKERAKRLAYVPQGAPVHWPLTVERIVGLGRTPHLNPWQELGDADQQIIQDVMQVTDCWSMRDRIVTTLSGGERSRVLLARAMAVGAPYLLADEPTASLDPLHQLQVMEIMRKVAAAGVGVLIVMHDLSFALRYCDRLVLLTGGAVLASGTPDEVLTDANLEAAFEVKVSRWDEDGEQFLAPHRVKALS